MGLSEREMWDSSPRAFMKMFEGFMEIQNRQTQAVFEAARLNSTIYINSISKRVYKPQQLVTFPWERQTVELDKKTIKRLKDKYEPKRIKHKTKS
jgi:hypothetical protein